MSCDSHQLRPFQMGTSPKGKNSLPMGSELFPLRAVCGMDQHWVISIFITHMRNCVMGAAHV